MSSKNIYQRVNAVMKEVEYVQKDVSVTGGGGGYKAVSHDMVLAVLRKSMVDHGIVTRVEQRSGEILQMRDLSKEIKMHLYAGEYAISFVNIDNPDDSILTVINAHAADNGDKAPGKCASYAVKYAMLKTFGLETGENEESRTYEAPQYTEIQKQQFDEFIENNDDGLGFVCFAATVGEDVMTALNSSFDKGKISSGKATLRALQQAGWGVVKEAAAQIAFHVDNSDDAGILEVMTELAQPVERRLLAGLLNPSQIKSVQDALALNK